MVESNSATKGSSAARGRSQQRHQPTQIVTQTPKKAQKKTTMRKKLKLVNALGWPIVEQDVKRSLRDMLIIQAIKMDATKSQELKIDLDDNDCDAPSYDLESVWDDFKYQAFERLHVKSVFAQVIASPIIWKSLTFLVIENQNIQKIFTYIQICIELKAVFLSGNQIITRDLPYIKHLANLRKADLSNNNIHFLPDDRSFEKLKKLQFLLLHKNQIVGWHQLDYLLALKQLRLLTCHSNPCTKVLGSREHIIEGIPQLWCLDDMIVSDFERKKFVDLNIDASKVTLNRFTPQQYLFCSMPPPKKNIQKTLEEEWYRLRRAYEYTSPFLTIQKTWRMWSQKMRYNRIKRHMKILFWAATRYYKRWFYRKLVFNQKLTFELLRDIGHVRRIQKRWREYRRKKLLRDVYSVKLQSIYRMNKAQMEVPIDFYTSDLTMVLTETYADANGLGGVVMPGVYVLQKDLPQSRSFLLGNIQRTMLQVGLKPIRKQDENIRVKRFSNLKPKREPRVLKKKKKFQRQIKRALCLVRVAFESMADLIWRYNRILKTRNLVCIYPQKVLNRVIAAVRLQSWWKGMRLRLFNKPLFDGDKRLLRNIEWKNVTLANTKYQEFVAVLRAAVVIQKWIKGICLRSRLNALTAICQHVRQISNEPLYLEQNLYLNIEKIINQCSPVKLQERKLRYQIIDGVVHMRSQVKRYQQTVLPNWLLEQVGLNIPLIPENMKNRKNPSILEVLHSKKNSDVSVVDSLSLECCTARKFVKFQFKSIEECQKIACLIALLTCQYLKGPTHFVHLIQKDQMVELDGNTQTLLLYYQLRDFDETFALRNTQEQVHDGIIIKKQNPFSTQLRSRPKHDARNRGQLIILKDADPKLVEQELKKAFSKQIPIRAEDGAVNPTIAQNIESQNFLSGAYQSHLNMVIQKPLISKKEQAQQRTLEEKREVQRFKLQLLNKKMKDLEHKVAEELKQIESLDSHQLNESYSQKLINPGPISGHASINVEIKTKKASKSPLHSRRVSADKAPSILVKQEARKDDSFMKLEDYEKQKEIMQQKIKELQKQREEAEHELSRKKFIGRKKEKEDKAEISFQQRKGSASRIRKRSKKSNEGDLFYITKDDTRSVATDPGTLNASPQRKRSEIERGTLNTSRVQERQGGEEEEKAKSNSPKQEPKSRYYKIVRRNSATKPLVPNNQGKTPKKAYVSPYRQQEQVLAVTQKIVSKTSRPGFTSETHKQPVPQIDSDAASRKPFEQEKRRSLDHSEQLLKVPNRNAPPLSKTQIAGPKPEVMPVKAVLVFQSQKSQNTSGSQQKVEPKITIHSVPQQEKRSIIVQSMSVPDLLSVKHSNLARTQFKQTPRKIESTPKSQKIQGHDQGDKVLSSLKILNPPKQNRDNLLLEFLQPMPQKRILQKTPKKLRTAKALQTTASHTMLPTLKVFENVQLQELIVAKHFEEPIIQSTEIKTIAKPTKLAIPLKSQQMQPMFPNNFSIEPQGVLGSLQVNKTINTKINNMQKSRQQHITITQKNTPNKATNIQTLMLSGTGSRVQAIPKKVKKEKQLKKYGSSGSLGQISNLSEFKGTVNIKTRNERKSSIDTFYSEYDSQMYHIERGRLLSAKPTPEKKVVKRSKILPQSTIEHVISQRETSQQAMKKSKKQIFTANSERIVYSLKPSKSFLPRINKNSSLARLQSEIINRQIIGDFCRF